MNKTHRIVWSEARQTYVVAHENAASCGKPSSTRKGMAQATAVALLALGDEQQVFATKFCGTQLTTPGVAYASGSFTVSSRQAVGHFCDIGTAGNWRNDARRKVLQGSAEKLQTAVPSFTIGCRRPAGNRRVAHKS
jgi:hypothetical protein